jgi:8-oxo-dGTP pyrophosphatase MutT (NUDIX family)
MVAGSILPIAFHKNKLYFLFGKENPMEDSCPGFSDFGGGLEGNETVFQTAVRECAEEISGFFGDEKDIRRWIKQNGGYFLSKHGDYHIHIVLTEYDENLPKYYNQNHRFLWSRMDKHYLNKTKLFEKIEICWFSVDDLKTRRNEFRKFYRDFIDEIVLQLPEIADFAKKSKKIADSPKNKTRKLR